MPNHNAWFAILETLLAIKGLAKAYDIERVKDDRRQACISTANDEPVTMN